MLSTFFRQSLTALAAALLLSAAAGFAEPIAILPKASAGETFRLVMTKSRERQMDGQQSQANKIETLVEVAVLEAGPNRAVLAWTAGESRLVEPKAAPDANMAALMNLARGVRLELELEGPAWTPRLRNYDEVKVRFDQIVEQVVKMPRNDRERGQLRQALDRMFASRESVEATVLRDAAVYLFPLGKTIEAGVPLSYDAMVATPLGGNPIRARGTVRLVSSDLKSGSAKFEWSQVLDREAANEAIKAWVERTAKRMGKPMPPDDKLPQFEISDRGEFVVRVASGWSDSARHTRRIVAPGAAETQTVDFVRKK